ncbi:MAG: hypothetical protein K0Q63_1231 [Paenibacillus sp.]|nr:hypothetical protein [Paenibacillus sp.]
MQTEDFIQKQETTGKRILQLLVITNLTLFIVILVMSLLSGIFHNIIGLIMMIILCIFIYNGGQIAKWIYIVANTLIVFNVFRALFAGVVYSSYALLDFITIVMLFISILTSLTLIFSANVKEFMYKQRY